MSYVHDLIPSARPDEPFHVQHAQPFCMAFGFGDWLYRRVEWYNVFLANGTPGRFTSSIVLWFFRWYTGTVKCNGTLTYAWWAATGDRTAYVMTTAPWEMLSVRLRWRKPGREVWSNMGGI